MVNNKNKNKKTTTQFQFEKISVSSATAGLKAVIYCCKAGALTATPQLT